MNRLRLALLGALLSTGAIAFPVGPAHAMIDLAFDSRFQHSPQELTTENIWKLDPDEANPHRQRWILQRSVELKGLLTHVRKGHSVTVSASGVVVDTLGFLRPDGSWYRPLSDFSCKVSDPKLSTPGAARKAMEAAAKEWSKFVSAERTRLGVKLAQISASSSELAMHQARQVYRDWLRGLELQWRTRLLPQAKKLEEKFAFEEAKASHVCGKGAHLRWEQLMEPVPVTPVAERKLLARVPARRWDGLFSVRANVNVGTRALNGQFLIDSSSPTSILSPIWLDFQGMPPDWLALRGSAPQRVPSTYLLSGPWGGGLAPWAVVKQTDLSGYVLPIHDFLLSDIDFFLPPEYLAPCCDGVLGHDFLKNAVVEFLPTDPPALNIWAREGFRMPEGTPWVEVSLDPRIGFVSDCESSSQSLSIPGAHWDTGSDTGMAIHDSYRTAATKSGSWRLQCGDAVLGEGISPTIASEKSVAQGLRNPGVTYGMPFLSRAGFTFDLPHGRIWFAKEAFGKEVSKNRSGLSVEYVFKNGDRALKVIGIRKGSPADLLRKAGLKEGMVITQINSTPAEELDLWQVDQRLSGSAGETVTLTWPTKHGLKMAPLKVR